MDLHKYGYVQGCVGDSCTAMTTGFLTRCSFYDQWGSGLYGTPAIAGAPTAAPIVAAWAVGQYLGVEGYLEIVAGPLAPLRTASARDRSDRRAPDRR